MDKTQSNIFLKILLYLTIFTIIVPIIVLILWTFANKWPWPNLLPSEYSLRSIKEIFAPHGNIFSILFSSILLSLSVAVLSAVVSTMTARALIFYDFFGKSIIDFIALAPNLVPSTVFAMGIHVVFIKMSLSDTIFGVIIVHLIYTLPYSVNIMKDLTESIGEKMEIQANVLGASPIKSMLYITLPLLMPGIMTSMIMAYIISFSQYFITLLIGGGKIKTLSMIMVPFISKGDRTLGSTYALLFVFSALFVFAIMDRLIKKLPYQNKGGNNDWS